MNCPACRAPVDPADTACPRCGTPLADQATTPPTAPLPLGGAAGGPPTTGPLPDDRSDSDRAPDAGDPHHDATRAYDWSTAPGQASTPVYGSWDSRVAAPQWSPPPPPPQHSDRRAVLIGVASGSVVLALGLAAAFAFGLLGSSRETPPPTAATTSASPTSAPSPTPTTPTETTSEPTESTSSPSTPTTSTTSPTAAEPSQTIYQRISGVGGHFPNAGTLNESTSVPFMQAVADEYARSGADGGSTRVRAYSPTTDMVYDIDCTDQGDGTVICAGGRNARIILWGATGD